MKKGLFAGSFDPPTLGHINIIERATKLFDELVIAVTINPDKQNLKLFTLQEKVALLAFLFKKQSNIKIISFNALLIDIAKKEKVTCLVRSIRSISDFDHELKLAAANRKMSSLDTLFLMSDPKFSHISSSLVREIASLNGPIEHFVSDHVLQKIREKYR